MDCQFLGSEFKTCQGQGGGGKSLPFTRQQNFSRVQIENICRRQFQCGSNKVQLFFDRTENIGGERENTGFQDFFFFFHFPLMFSKAFFSRVVENQGLFGKGLQNEQECIESELHIFFFFFFLIQGQITLDTLI